MQVATDKWASHYLFARTVQELPHYYMLPMAMTGDVETLVLIL